MNRGLLPGAKPTTFVPHWLGGNEPANDGAVLTGDSTAPGGAALRRPFQRPSAPIGNLFVPVGEDISEEYESWPWQAVIRSGGQLGMPAFMEGTYNGITSTTLVTKYKRMLGPVKPHFCAVNTGRWDFTGGTPVTLAQYQANVRSICSYLVSVDIMPILCTIPPRVETADSANTTAYKVGITAANMWLKNFAALSNFPLVDFYGPLVDAATGSLLAAYVSGVGMNLAGHTLLADTFLAAVRTLLRPWTAIKASYDGDTNSLLANGMALVDTDADGVIDGWTTINPAVTFVPSVVTDARFKGGKGWQLAWTAPSNPLPYVKANNVNNPTTKITGGDLIAFCFKYSVESTTGFSTFPEQNGLSANMFCPSVTAFWNYHSTAGVGGGLNEFCGLLYLPVNAPTTPSNFTRSLVAPAFQPLGIVGKSFVVRVGDMAVYNLTRLGVLENALAAGTHSWLNSPNDNTNAYYPEGT